MEGEVKMPLEEYHNLRRKISELKEELEGTTQDAKQVTSFAREVSEASDQVAEFLSMLYEQNSGYIEGKVREFNRGKKNTVFVLDRENKKITIQLTDNEQQRDST